MSTVCLEDFDLPTLKTSHQQEESILSSQPHPPRSKSTTSMSSGCWSGKKKSFFFQQPRSRSVNIERQIRHSSTERRNSANISMKNAFEAVSGQEMRRKSKQSARGNRALCSIFAKWTLTSITVGSELGNLQKNDEISEKVDHSNKNRKHSITLDLTSTNEVFASSSDFFDNEDDWIILQWGDEHSRWKIILIHTTP
eukprot:753299-Hanusia_phi.AAC.2